MSHTVDVDGGHILYKYTWPHSTIHSLIQIIIVEMFSWLRDKTATSYDPVPNDRSSIVPQTTSSMSHQKQYSNGRQFYTFFYDFDRNVY
jgi:hypothetical protein